MLYKTELDKYWTDVTDINQYILHQNDELKQTQEEAKKATTAPAALADDEEGLTITPVIPVDISKKIDDAKDEIDRWKGQRQATHTAIQTAQSEKKKARDVMHRNIGYRWIPRD